MKKLKLIVYLNGIIVLGLRILQQPISLNYNVVLS